MADPIQPKYGPPFDPNAGGNGQPDPDSGKDLSYLDPTLQVIWYTDPSYNLDPPSGPGSSDAGKADEGVQCYPFHVETATLRSAEASLGYAAYPLIDGYQSLRQLVQSTKDTVFGQQATTYNSGMTATPVGGVQNAPPKTEASPVQGPAQQFAASIVPAEEKVLWQIATAIEVLGQYIAGVNTAGQTYGQADRKAMFPEPPANPVSGGVHWVGGGVGPVTST